MKRFSLPSFKKLSLQALDLWPYSRQQPPAPVLEQDKTGINVTVPGLDFSLRIDTRGKKPMLRFPYMSVSDIHYGTKIARAHRTAHMFEHTHADTLYLLGDIFDGHHMKTKDHWKFPEWHTQGVAHILRKAEQGARVVYIPGNHDMEVREQRITWRGPDIALNKGRSLKNGAAYFHRNLCDKKFLGVEVYERDIYIDPRGRRFLKIHTDQFDDELFGNNKSTWYNIGNFLYDALITADMWVQSLPKCEGISVAAISKHITKTIINEFLGVNKVITREIDNDSTIDGCIHGHSHMAGFTLTPKGKHIFNDGSCTEHVQALVHDSAGRFALIEWHRNRIDLTDERGQRRSLTWHELGLTETFGAPPQNFDDHAYIQARRLVHGPMRRLWSPLPQRA